MQLIKCALFLNATALFFVLSGSVTVISPFTIIYASLKARKFDHNIDVLILISLLTLQFPSD